MQIRLSGLRSARDPRESHESRPSEELRALAARLTELPRSALKRLASRVREVAIHVSAEHGNPLEPSLARVAVHRPRGAPISVTARGACPETAARAAVGRARRLLRRDASRKQAQRLRGVAA